MTIIYIIIWIALDLASKYLFFDLKLADNLFLPIANHGISYSMLSGQTKYIILATFVIFGIVTYMYYKSSITKIAYILVMAWWVWNLIDRIYYWYVRDFIYIWDWFPVFNLADILIFLGCSMMFYQIRTMDLEEKIP